MIGKSLSRNEMKGITGGDYCDSMFRCIACTSTCIYEVGGPGAGCPSGTCVLTPCASMEPCCSMWAEHEYRAVCDWEVWG